MKDEFKEWRQKERERFLSRNALQQMPLKERISAAKKHAVENGQMNDAMWQYQAFSLTVGELLNAAERAV
jgi:hypothetical protein